MINANKVNKASYTSYLSRTNFIILVDVSAMPIPRWLHTVGLLMMQNDTVNVVFQIYFLTSKSKTTVYLGEGKLQTST